MKFRSQSRILILLVLFFTLFLAQACSGSGRQEEINVQSTLVAIKLTQIYLEGQTTQMSAQPTDPSEEDSPPPVFEPPPQQEQEPDFSYEGISFSFSPAIAESARCETIPEYNPGPPRMEFDIWPTHYRCNVDLSAEWAQLGSLAIYVFPVEEYLAISEFAGININRLEEILINRPCMIDDEPFFPVWPVVPVISVWVAYFDFQSGTGVRYLTYITGEIFPFDNKDLTYTYQGITGDGRYYISAIAPITSPILPDDAHELYTEDDFDYDAFYNYWENYLSNITQSLGEQPLDSYNPSIALLDEIISSIVIKR